AAKYCALAARRLTEVMGETRPADHLHSLAKGLSYVAARLKRKQLAVDCSRAVHSLTQAMNKESGLHPGLRSGLLTVVAHLGPQEAAELAHTFTEAITKTTGDDAQRYLGLALSAVSERLERKEATRTCALAARTLTQAMRKTSAPSDLIPLGWGL